MLIITDNGANRPICHESWSCVRYACQVMDGISGSTVLSLGTWYRPPRRCGLMHRKYMHLCCSAHAS